MANGDPTEDMLSTEASARLMGCSRPHVAMLIDAQVLAGGIKNERGERMVPLASVERWIREFKNTPGDADYRKAGVEGGMYDIPDEVYSEHSLKSRRRARSKA